ncbi:MAG: Ig-like domain-containing protein [Ruminiclostridium sp.]|nr:Ig-like domain-containing protein [Ruminiclostridium sp.]
METKQITLRSQTVQCPHCGEYYSVTYKYCPFCDVGRQEEERRMAERKKQRQQKLGGLFGAEPEKKKKRPAEPAPRREVPVQDFEEEAPVKSASKKKESLFFSKPTRKKTSEMTEEEKKAFKAEREARAAERKRERDRLAREAALAAGQPDPIFDAADSYEAPTQETFEQAEVPAEAVVLQETPVEAAPAVETPAEVPVQAAPAAPAEPGPWDDLRQLEMTPNAPVVEVASEPVAAEAVQPAVTVQAEPVPAEKPVETDEDLDALLSEIRDMLADSPVPAVAASQLTKPVQPVVVTEAPVQGGARLAPEMPPVEVAPEAPAAPVLEVAVEAEPEVEVQPEAVPAAEEVPVQEAPVETPVEEPTIVIPTAEVAEAVAEAALVDETPTQVLPVEEIQALEAQAETPVVAAPIPETKEEPAPKKKAPKKKKKSILPVVLSLVLIVAAAFIVAKTLGPAFQDGLFSSQSADAETITLDQTEVTFAQAGATVPLTAIFAPEGTSAPVTWATSDEAIATVDENGTVTAVAKGLATITATLENGQTAQCVVNCSWEDAPAEPPAEEAVPAGPGLSASTITLDGQGKTAQLQVNGVEGAVTWSSNKTDVATVAEDGTVTAVAKGGATITAQVGDQTFTCEVKCIW